MPVSTTLVAVPPLRRDLPLMTLVALVHGASHFSQLLLPPLFPWLKEAFAVNYIQLGLVLTVFFVVSCAAQTVAGFLVDRYGPRRVLVAGLGLLALATAGFAAAPGYQAMLPCAALAGIGNGVFHPVDFTLLNRKLHKARLGHAYSLHGISGSLGWALAPAIMVPAALTFGWRGALAFAALLMLVALAVVAWQWPRLHVPLDDTAARPSAAVPAAAAGPAASAHNEGAFDFLRLPAVWMCFAFFLLFASILSAIQAFAPEAARALHGVPLHWSAMCLTIYMVCSAAGMVLGGFLASDPARCERIIAIGLSVAAAVALTIALAPLPGAAVPLLFGLMGASAGIASPSRDLLVKQSTPPNATGRVYGVVYSGLDIGQALAPLGFGLLMDHQRHAAVWMGIATLQLVLIATAFNVRGARRTARPA